MSEQTNKRKKESQPAKLMEKEIRLAATRGEVGWEGELKKGGKNKYTHTHLFFILGKKKAARVFWKEIFFRYFSKPIYHKKEKNNSANTTPDYNVLQTCLTLQF